jgi:3-isopropylmalate/(R)-2-methylmalate dehydratase small subunit
MIFKGPAWVFGDDIDTDVIIPVRFCNNTDPDEFGRHCMQGIDPDFPKKITRGDIIVAGKNFGCGSSREPAPISIKAAGISCVIAGTFARIFYRNAFNVGLPLLECVNASTEIREGNEIEVNINTGEILDVFTDKKFNAKPIPPFMQELIRDNGLMNHLAKKWD